MKFSIRLVICCNDCPIGPRLSRGTPLPPYQHTYDDTPEGREMAEMDISRIKKYVEDYENRKQRKK
jgi:hypothetical protein